MTERRARESNGRQSEGVKTSDTRANYRLMGQRTGSGGRERLLEQMDRGKESHGGSVDEQERVLWI